MGRERFFGYLLVVVALPLALRLIPPNAVYGVRSRETLASRGRWYDTNAKAGRLLLLGGAWLIGLSYLHPGWRLDAGALLANAYLIGPLIGAAAWLSRRSRKLTQ